MSKVSVIIPSRNEPYLEKTVKDIFEKATGEIEIIVYLDGPTEYPLTIDDPRLTIIQKGEPKGMRVAVNIATSLATGEYLLKCDAHCMFQEGFDEVLKADCDSDWVVIARRFSLDVDQWSFIPKVGIDYFYLTCPWTDKFSIVPWIKRGKLRGEYLIDETMAFQGSMYFMHTDYFINQLEQLDTENYHCWGESLEIVLKTWLSGGKVMVNKNTAYAQWHKAHLIPTYPISQNQLTRDHRHAAEYWTKNKWRKRIHDFDWLIDYFWPLPLKKGRCNGEKYYWPEDWRNYYDVCPEGI